MHYIDYINEILKPKITEKETVLDLFAGCGGLSLGFEAAGYKTIGFEMDENAVGTYKKNLSGACHTVKLCEKISYPSAEIIVGGPPCQPFSVGGKQNGLNDNRNGFPLCIDAVKKVKPQLFIFENVKGLLYKNKWYLDEVITEFKKLDYQVLTKLMNAKHFHVPQNRERIIIVGFKKGIYTFPEEKAKVITAGEALGKRALSIPKNAKFLTASMESYISKYEKASKCIVGRDLHLDRPARTLTCRNLAGSTGDMQRIKLNNSQKRRLTHTEAAILQSFPTWFKFIGNETSIYNQIGNAVPPMMSYHIAGKVKEFLNI